MKPIQYFWNICSPIIIGKIGEKPPCDLGICSRSLRSLGVLLLQMNEVKTLSMDLKKRFRKIKGDTLKQIKEFGKYIHLNTIHLSCQRQMK